MRNKRILLIIFIAGLLFRIFFVSFFVSLSPAGDGIEYIRLAKNIAVYGVDGFFSGYNSRRAPIYPLFLSVFFKFYSRPYYLILLSQAFISALLIPVIYRIAFLLFDYKTALISALFSAFYPIFIYYGGMFLTENLFVFLMTFSVMMLLESLNTERNKYILFSLASILLGISSLTRPVAFLILPSFFIYLFFLNVKYKVKIISLILIFFSLALSPWWIRNYKVMHKFIPFTTEGAVTFSFSNNKYADGSGSYRKSIYRLYYRDKVDFYSKYPDEYERYAALMQKTKRFIIDNPKFFLWLMWDKFLWFWNIFPHTGLKDKIISVFSYGLILPFFIIGFAQNIIYKKRKSYILHIIILAFTLFHITFAYGSVRFRMPIAPYIIILASYAIIKLHAVFKIRTP